MKLTNIQRFIIQVCMSTIIVAYAVYLPAVDWVSDKTAHMGMALGMFITIVVSVAIHVAMIYIIVKMYEDVYTKE